jgi:hypothetical protein
MDADQTLGDPQMNPDPEQTLARESRARPRAVAVAVAAAVGLIVASILQLGGAHTKVDELTLDLLVANHRYPRDLIAAIVNAGASLAIMGTLLYLWRAARARKPERVRGYIRVLTLLGGVLAALTGIVYAIIVADKVHQFATTGTQTYAEANRITGGSGLLALQLLGQASALLVAVAFVLVSLQAMNQGLLTKLMGYGGMFAGALVLFPLLQVPAIQVLWLLSVALMVSGRTPSGVPPAWRTGRAEPWPSGAEMRTRRAAQTATPTGRGGGAAVASPASGLAGLFGGRSSKAASAPPEQAPKQINGSAEPRTRATTPKRKRKRRS